jgi:carbon-monoxide dehydrogenase large subunit
VGEPVAAVVGRDRYEAEDLAEQVRVVYEPLPAVVDALEALLPTAPRVHPHRDNVFYRQRWSTPGVEEAFARARHVVRVRLRTRRQTAAPLEERGCVASYDPGRGELMVYLSTQWPHGVRTELSRLLGLDESRVRVVAPDVGGAFGMKATLYPEEVVVALLAIKLGRPVRWVSDRREGLLADVHARDDLHEAEAAVDAEGRVWAVRDRIVADGGAYQAYPESGAVGEAVLAARMLLGPYRIPEVAYEIVCTYTHRTPTGAYRGVWGPIATQVQESLMEEVARVTGLSPLTVRQRNLIPPEAFPYRTATGMEYDSGHYALALEEAWRAADGDGAAARKAQSQAKGRRRGVGISLFVEPAAFADEDGVGYEMAQVEMDPRGTVTVRVGTCPSGQGHETAFAQIVACELGVTLEAVRVVVGDSAAVPYGGGTGGSRSLVLGGGAVASAARQLAERLRALAARQLEADAQDVVLAGGQAYVRGTPGRAVPVASLARAAYLEGSRRHPGAEAGLFAQASYRPGRAITFPFGCHVAEVEVDPETGQAKVVRYTAHEDCGPQLNPALVEGQILGGVAQGIGSVFLEHLPYGPDGQPLAQTLMDYLLPTAQEVGPVSVVSTSTPSPFTLYGAKGVGEAALIAAPAALSLAVQDALGCRVEELPLRPSDLWDLARKGGNQDAFTG